MAQLYASEHTGVIVCTFDLHFVAQAGCIHETLASAARFHIETFGPDVKEGFRNSAS